MNNERTWVMTPDMRRNASTREINAAMKAAGIKFDRDECPVRITKPWEAQENEDGSVTFRQWED
jgi:hypothetical protein